MDYSLQVSGIVSSVVFTQETDLCVQRETKSHQNVVTFNFIRSIFKLSYIRNILILLQTTIFS